MTDVVQLPSLTQWNQPCSADERQRAVQALERGDVVMFPNMPFTLLGHEGDLLQPGIAGAARKNVSLKPSGELQNAGAQDDHLRLLQAMMRRFSKSTRALMDNLYPAYKAGLKLGRTSFRPVEIEGRATSWRKDDTRLHVDSFPSTPMRGVRILRVFSNINPNGEARRWRMGEHFENVAKYHLPKLPAPLPGANRLLNMLGVTKSLRSDYDHFMLRLHDRMKADLDYQRDVKQTLFEFAPGTSWMVFTDQASHAAMHGQYALEQTMYLPVESMSDPLQSPLKVLERLVGRELV